MLLGAVEPQHTRASSPGDTTLGVRHPADCAAYAHVPLTQIPRFLTIRPRPWLRPMTQSPGGSGLPPLVHPGRGLPAQQIL